MTVGKVSETMSVNAQQVSERCRNSVGSRPRFEAPDPQGGGPGPSLSDIPTFPRRGLSCRNVGKPEPTQPQVARCIHCGSTFLERGRCLDCGRPVTQP